MSIEFRLDGVLLTNKISIPQDTNGGFVSAAERGAIGRGGVVIEDPAGELDFSSWRAFTVDDTDATPTRVWTGHIIDRDLSRGNQPTAGVARVHDCRLEDQNGLLHMVLNRLQDNDAKRPAETDSVRVPWLLTSRALDGLVFDRGLVSLANPGAFLASDCRRRFADDVLSEMAPSAVKNFFVYRDEATGDPALFWDRDTSEVWPATIAISNDRADVDADPDAVFFPEVDAKVARGDPADGPYTGVDMAWNGGDIFVESAATIAGYGMRREFAYDNPRVGLAATADAQAAAWLNVHAGETDFISVSILVPSTHVNRAYAGQEINVRFVHVPGFEEIVTTRIRRRTATPVPSGHWRLDLELWVPSTPATDAAPQGCGGSIVQTKAQGFGINFVVFDADTVAGKVILLWETKRDEPCDAEDSPSVDWLALSADVSSNGAADGDHGRWWYCESTATDSYEVGSNSSRCYGYETDIDFATFDPGAVALYEVDDAGASTALNLGTVTDPLAGQIVLAGLTYDTGFGGSVPATPGTGWDMDYNSNTNSSPPVGASDQHPHTLVMRWDDSTTPLTGTATIGSAWPYCGVMIQIGEGCEDDPLPIVGAPVSEVPSGAVDSSNTAFSTAGGWLPNTLTVLHDGINETSSVINADPVAGTFELTYAPSFGSTIRVRYKSA